MNKILHFKPIFNSLKMCLIENDLVSNHIAKSGMWEPHLYFFYSNFIKKHYTIIDGGANIGFHTINFGYLAQEGKVLAFEPQNLIYNVLSTNILINDLSEIVEQYRLGLGSNSTDKLTFTPIEEQFFGNNVVNYGGRGLTTGDDANISIINIDSLNLSNLDLIKLDVQGMEQQVIDGGIETIQKNKPILILEAGISSASKFFKMNGPILSSNNVTLFDKLKDMGYIPYQLCSQDNYFFGDTIFLHKDNHQDEMNFMSTQTLFKFLN
jgi:FkbM family methyltransferase